jgi:di/tricarboxylate transporter
MAFITPLGHPVNILVMTPGGYRFKDYLRVGLPLTIILFILLLVLLPVFWPLTPA